MKYWPLTAVLLAFWLGRQTGASDDEPKIAMFDEIEARVIRCGSIVLSETRAPAEADPKPAPSSTMTLSPSGCEIHDSAGARRVLFGHGKDGSVLVFMGQDGKRQIALLDGARTTGLVVVSKDQKLWTFVSGDGVSTK